MMSTLEGDPKELIRKNPHIDLLTFLNNVSGADGVIPSLLKAIGFREIESRRSRDGVEFFASLPTQPAAMRLRFANTTPAQLSGAAADEVRKAFDVVSFFENDSHEASMMPSNLREAAINRFCEEHNITPTFFFAVTKNWV